MRYHVTYTWGLKSPHNWNSSLSLLLCHRPGNIKRCLTSVCRVHRA